MAKVSKSEPYGIPLGKRRLRKALQRIHAPFVRWRPLFLPGDLVALGDGAMFRVVSRKEIL